MSVTLTITTSAPYIVNKPIAGQVSVFNNSSTPWNGTAYVIIAMDGGAMGGWTYSKHDISGYQSSSTNGQEMSRFMGNFIEQLPAGTHQLCATLSST